MHVAVIGCGNMGSSIIKGLSDRHHIKGYDKNLETLQQLNKLDSRNTELDGIESSFVFLAVKPKQVEQVLEAVSLDSNQVLISVGAGIDVEYLEKRTEAKVVRMMPNLGAEYGEMAGAITSSNQIDEDVVSLVNELGEVVEIEERHMDLATAINGSGPAFIYYLMDALKQSGVERGLNSEKAEQLVVQTFRSASEIASNSEHGLEELIQMVCSEGGTTIEGMKELRKSEVAENIDRAVQAAEERSRQISLDLSDVQRNIEAERIVVKVGTSSITNGEGVDRELMQDITSEISALINQDREVVLVTSGAIGAGKLNISEKVEDKQAAATIGQNKLMSTYSEMFSRNDVEIGQVLLTQQDFEITQRQKKFKNTIEKLLEWGIVPIVNENDAVATEEIKVGDNDIISSKLAREIEADLLITLTDVDGVQTGHPKNEESERISKAKKEDERIRSILDEKERRFAGIKTKIEGAVTASEQGIDTVIANSSEKDIINKILNGKDVGTYFEAVE